MKKVKILYKKISEGINLFAKKTIRIIRHIFKKGNTALWVLDGLVVILIIIVAINIFSGVRKTELVKNYSTPEASPEESSGSLLYPKEATVGGAENNVGWKTLGSFGGIGSGENYVKIDPKVHWRIVLGTKTLSRETSILNLFVYHKESPQGFVEKFTKELEDRGDGKGVANDIIEVCDTSGGEFIIEVKSNNFDWNVDVETLDN